MTQHFVIVSSNAWPAIVPVEGRGTGGLETFAWNFAKHVAQREDARVSFIVRTSQRNPPDSADGVSLLAISEPLRNVRQRVASQTERCGGFPWLRVKSWNASLFWQIPLLAAVRLLPTRIPDVTLVRDRLRSAGADVAVALGVSEESACVVGTAEELGIPSVLWLQSNGDLDARFFESEDFVDVYSVTSRHAQAAVKGATRIICQTKWQQLELQRLTGRNSAVIVNPIDVSRWTSRTAGHTERDYVLWIGRFDRHHKRPHLCLEVARRVPDVPFVMVVNGGQAEVENEIRRELPDNIEIREPVSHERMPELFGRARLFLCTGSHEFEGFPNVLLEASAAGVPSVSLCDFDDFIATSGCGSSSKESVEDAAESVARLWRDAAQWELCSQAAVGYVSEHHSFSPIVDQFMKVAASSFE